MQNVFGRGTLSPSRRAGIEPADSAPHAFLSPRKTAAPTGRRSGVTLLEILIATTLFSLLAAGLTALYTANLRFAKAQSYRTQAITAAMSLVEQIRFNGYPDILTKYYTPSTPENFVVKIVDPTVTSGTPTGYRDLTVPINVRDSTTLNTNWTTTSIYIEPSAAAPKLPMRFWVTLTSDAATSGTIHEIFRLAVVYQYRLPNASTNDWETGNLRVVIPKLSAYKPN
jgi:prepilin-type N-terminal cleavage/methylation domain-containing protein